ncbi:MAG: TrpR-like protein YerC/YecD [Clostridia bacterium]|nr:TrpR-like protein YerC/YecD [Clostridia bacterium]
MDHLNTKSIERLFKVILRLESLEECKNFFEDVCTIKEVIDMAQRLDVAVLLENKLSYQDISEQTKVSSATISRVNRCLNYGNGGYRTAIEKMPREERD